MATSAADATLIIQIMVIIRIGNCAWGNLNFLKLLLMNWVCIMSW